MSRAQLYELMQACKNYEHLAIEVGENKPALFAIMWCCLPNWTKLYSVEVISHNGFKLWDIIPPTASFYRLWYVVKMLTLEEAKELAHFIDTIPSLKVVNSKLLCYKDFERDLRPIIDTNTHVECIFSDGNFVEYDNNFYNDITERNSKAAKEGGP
jgi:hypothetical protein